MAAKVKELLQNKGHDVWSVSPNDTVLEALAVMDDKNIGAVLVTEGGKLAGIFSERDFARKVATEDIGCRDTAVKELMTPDIIAVDPDTAVEHCMALMTEKRIRHLPVLEGGKLYGMLTIGDVVKHVISKLEITVRDLENYISGGGYGG